jgi:hypothetical protein
MRQTQIFILKSALEDDRFRVTVLEPRSGREWTFRHPERLWRFLERHREKGLK